MYVLVAHSLFWSIPRLSPIHMHIKQTRGCSNCPMQNMDEGYRTTKFLLQLTCICTCCHLSGTAWERDYSPHVASFPGLPHHTHTNTPVPTNKASQFRATWERNPPNPERKPRKPQKTSREKPDHLPTTRDQTPYLERPCSSQTKHHTSNIPAALRSRTHSWTMSKSQLRGRPG